MTAFELLTFIHQNELTGFYPNVWVALRIACALPVTVASAEMSFSKLKLVKTYLRTTRLEARFPIMMMMMVINDFASQKARRQEF